MALPVLGSLAASGPDIEVWAAGEPWVGDLLSPELGVRGFLPLPQPRGIKRLKAAARELETRRFDAGLLLTNSFGTALLFRLAGIPERWGYSRDRRGPLLTRRVRVKDAFETRHQRDYYLDLLAPLGFRASYSGSGLKVTPEETVAAEKALDRAGRNRSRPLGHSQPRSRIRSGQAMAGRQVRIARPPIPIAGRRRYPDRRLGRGTGYRRRRRRGPGTTGPEPRRADVPSRAYRGHRPGAPVSDQRHRSDAHRRRARPRPSSPSSARPIPPRQGPAGRASPS